MSDPANIAAPVADPDAVVLTPETLALIEQGRQGLPTPVDPMTPVTVAPPEGVPVKFWDPIKGVVRTEDLLKSYAELEKNIGQPKVAEPATEPVVEPVLDADGKPVVVEPVVDPEAIVADPVLATAVTAAATAYADTGELSDELRAPFLAAGISTEQIDLYLQGVKTTENALVAAVTEPFGSREAFDEAVAWAVANWNVAQINAFNSQTGDVSTAKLAAVSLKAAFAEANPGEGTLIDTGGGIPAGDTYGHMDEFQRDMAESEKMRDPIKRREALEKLSRSRKAGRIKNTGPNRPF